MRPPALVSTAGLVILWICAASAATAVGNREDVQITALWQAPVDLPHRDLVNGPWGARYAPDPDATYTFLRPKKGGVNPGVVVRDLLGRTWHVKQARDENRDAEGPVEVVLSRVLSAVGYHQPPVYFLPSFTIADASGTHRAPGGRFRLDEPSLQDCGNWSWRRNPFLGTRPYQALLVILLVFNSWDLKDSNNTLYEFHRDDQIERRYVVRDLGGALGDTGRFGVKRNNIKEFERNRFIIDIDDGFVRFDYRGKQPKLMHRITVEDVRWASELLSGLEERQWRDAFRTGGYESDIAERFIKKIRSNIAAGLQLPGAETAVVGERR